MTKTPDFAPALPPQPASDARDLQARLYRDIGISAVAAALRFVSQPDPDKQAPQTESERLQARRSDRAA